MFKPLISRLADCHRPTTSHLQIYHIIILYSKSNTAYRYINTNCEQYMIHYTQYIIIAEHDINLGITNFFSHI
jgi:hypothetical protein